MIGTYRHRVTVDTPTPTPDGSGGYVDTWTPLSPATWDCSLEPATARDLEAFAAGTILATASHVVRGRHHPGITTKTRITFDGGRVLNVVGVANREERNIETLCVCAEVVS